ncbi:MAG: hypothetical protein ABEJ03_02195 [Candidatus Nanohaloarchaea archaeon]
MIFSDSDTEDRKEVRINAREENDEKDEESSKLEKEAESKLVGGSGSETTLKDIHSQNERIIELLEQLSEDEDRSSNGGAQPGELL